MHTAVIRLACDFNIGLIMWGEDGELEYGGTTKNKNKFTYDLDYIKNEMIEGDYERIMKASNLDNKDLFFLKFPSKEEVFPDNNDDLLDFYSDFHKLGMDRRDNWEDLLKIFSISSADAIFQLQHTQIELGNEIEKLSNYEVWIIFIAFIIQVIVFILIQFFELGVISRERNK